jgi:hypothetical protein
MRYVIADAEAPAKLVEQRRQIEERERQEALGDHGEAEDQEAPNRSTGSVGMGTPDGAEHLGSDGVTEKPSVSIVPPVMLPCQGREDPDQPIPVLQNKFIFSETREERKELPNGQQCISNSLPSSNTQNNQKNDLQQYSAGPDAGKLPSECRKTAIRMPEPDAGPSAGPSAGPDAGTSEASKREEALREVEKSEVLSLLLDLDSPERTLRNVCQFILGKAGSLQKARIAIKALRLDSVFYPDDWYGRLGRMYDSMKKKFVGGSKPKEELVFSFALRQVIKKVVPSSEWHLAAKSQRVLLEELVYVAKTITGKVLRRWNREGCDCAVVAHAYFRHPKYAEAYKKATGRSVGKSNHKIGRITDLLDRYGLVIKVARRDEGNRQRACIYRIGNQNPYYRRVERKTAGGDGVRGEGTV